MVLQMLTRVLIVKKGAPQADRVIKFVGGYIKFVNEKAAEDKAAQGDEYEKDDNTTASRFTAALLRFLLKGFLAKDKSIRYRVLQTVAEMVSHLGEIEEDIYKELRAALLERVNDKETPVRFQAVIALSKLCGSEDPSEVSEGEQTVSDTLIDILAHDTSPEVRRAALLNIPITTPTILHILERTRDTDVTIRKLVYSTVLEPNVLQGETTNIGPAHPRALTIAQRELIVRSGLGDREQSVRTAAASLLGAWVDAIAESDTEDVESGVVALLKMFDLAESNVAADALLSVFVTRADIFDNMEFGDSYWTNLTPETAFLARVFVDHCRATKEDARLDNTLPVVTALAFRIQEAYNDLLEDMQNEEHEQVIRDMDEEERIRLEDVRLDKEFVIGEMLKLAVNLDYTDEIGRRKMFTLVRDMLSQEQLPESLLPKCLDVLRQLSASERDLIRVCVEIVHELRDPKEEEEEEDLNADVDAETNFGDTPTTVKPPRSQLFNKKKPEGEQLPEEKARADGIDLRCLSLCTGMLERVNSKLEENSTLDGILRELIIPSVKRKELPFREKGFVVLGLCCLIAKRLALSSIHLFFTQIPSSPEVLKISIIQVVFDMLMVHEDILGKDDNSANITKYLISLLGTETSEKVQALLCIGISKLVLSGMITDVEAVKNLVMAYLSPTTVDNQELRQCLTFFFPVYSYSSPTNQRCMREIFIEMFVETNKTRKELDEDEEMVSAAQVGALFIDWTDPLKLTSAFDARLKTDTKNQTDDFIHLDLAGDIFKALLQRDFDKEEKKVLCQLLGKLYVPDTVDDDQIRTLKLLMHNVRLRRPLRGTITNSALTKFETTITKKFEKQLEDFDEEEYRKLEQLQELFKFLDKIIPEDDDEVISLDQPKRKGRKRRSGSIATTTTEGERDETPSTTSTRGRSKTKAKRRRLSNSDDDSDDDSELGTPPPRTSAPTRAMPKRSAAAKKPAQVIAISSDEEATPVARKSRPQARSEVKEETEVDADIDHLLDHNNTAENTFDSIMDDDSEEEEEVNDLLAEE